MWCGNAVASGNIQSDVDYDKYVEMRLKEGSFDHTIDTQVASFISDLLDVTIVKPILEAIIGVDLITHDDLNGIERCFKLGMAVIDIMTLGQAGIFEGGLKAGAKSLLKSMGIEFLSNGAALTVNKAGEMLNIPEPILLLLSLGTGYTVAHIGTKSIVKNAEGKIIYEADDVINEVSKAVEAALAKGSKKTWEEFLKANPGKNVEEASRSYINLIEGQSPWPEGFDTTAHTTTLKSGNTFQMSLDEAQPVTSPGNFATSDNIPNADYVRNNLAVKSDWKADCRKVVTYRVKEGMEIPVIEGPVGAQIDLNADKYLSGGGSQIQMLLDRSVNKMDYLEVVFVGSIN